MIPDSVTQQLFQSVSTHDFSTAYKKNEAIAASVVIDTGNNSCSMYNY